MRLSQIVIALIVLVTLARIDRARAKLVARRMAAAVLRRLFVWTSHPLPLRAGPCIVFAPHQDDETLGCGALIARRRNEGLPVHVIFITDGSASHPLHPTLSSATITDLRDRESAAALATLGVESVAIHRLGAIDGSLDSLSGERRDALVARIAALLETVAPGEIFLPCCPDGSTEHEAAFALVQHAIYRTPLRPAVWQYPVWSWWNPVLLLEALVTAPVRCTLATEDFGPLKDAALGRYRSQSEPTPPWTEPVLPPDLLQLFKSQHEYFIRYDLPEHPPSATRVI